MVIKCNCIVLFYIFYSQTKSTIHTCKSYTDTKTTNRMTFKWRYSDDNITLMKYIWNQVMDAQAPSYRALLSTNNKTRQHYSHTSVVWPSHKSWWRHQMEIFTGEFPSQWPVTLSFDVFFDLRLNKGLSKHSWFETPSRSLWRHCNAIFGIQHSELQSRYFVHVWPVSENTKHS